MGDRTYIAIDLKSFYASVECVERGLDPLDTCLVVADSSRTEKTICLAVTPPLKAYGISGRARLFEVVQQVKTENARRRGRYAKRDSMGRYSRDDGYTRRDGRVMRDGYSRDEGKAYMMEQLEDMMEDAEKPAEKEVLRRCMEALKRA